LNIQPDPGQVPGFAVSTSSTCAGGDEPIEGGTVGLTVANESRTSAEPAPARGATWCGSQAAGTRADADEGTSKHTTTSDDTTPRRNGPPTLSQPICPPPPRHQPDAPA